MYELGVFGWFNKLFKLGEFGVLCVDIFSWCRIVSIGLVHCLNKRIVSIPAGNVVAVSLVDQGGREQALALSFVEVIVIDLNR